MPRRARRPPPPPPSTLPSLPPHSALPLVSSAPLPALASTHTQASSSSSNNINSINYNISDSPDGEVALALANCLNSLFELRDLRTDVTAARTRVAYLNKELSSLEIDRNRANEAKDRLEALSRELSRQNKAMLDKKLAQQDHVATVVVANKSTRDEKRDYAIERLRRAVKDAEERYIIRGQLFDTRTRRKSLQKLLRDKRNAAIQENKSQLEEAQINRKDTEECTNALIIEKKLYTDSNTIYTKNHQVSAKKLDKLRMEVAGYKAKNYEGFETVKELQASNQKKRNENQATRVQIKMLAAEEARLEENINTERAIERKERTKREMLESLFQKVTVERADLKKDVVILSESWSNLKIDIDKLKGNCQLNGNAGNGNTNPDEGESNGNNSNDPDGGNRVFDVLQSIMNREYLEGAISGVMVGSAIEDAIKHLRIAARETLSLSANGDKKRKGNKKKKAKAQTNNNNNNNITNAPTQKQAHALNETAAPTATAAAASSPNSAT